MSLRITSGEFRGKRLAVLQEQAVRPTSEKVRASLFNVLGPAVSGKRFLDAFAGTGAVGLEALSRGAAFAVFIEQDPAICRTLRENIRELGVQDRCLMIEKDFFGVSMAIKSTCHILFFDPPYHTSCYQNIMDHLNQGMEIGDNCVVVMEHFKKNKLPVETGHLVRRRFRTYGDTILSFYEKIQSKHS